MLKQVQHDECQCDSPVNGEMVYAGGNTVKPKPA